MSDSLTYIILEEDGPFLPNWSKSNSIVYHLSAEPDVLHPTNGASSARAEIMQYTQMYLVRTNMRTLEPAPALLVSYPNINSDGLSYDCTLRNDVRWDDGSPITYEDVIFTAKANKFPLTENPVTKPFWSNLKEIIPDSSDLKKFRVVMKKPYLYNILFWSDFPIMQRSKFDPANILSSISFTSLDDSSWKSINPDLSAWSKEFNGPGFSRDPKLLSGAGPYQVVSWVAGQEIVLSKKRNHWSDASKSVYEKSNPDRIIFRVNKDPNSQILEFKSMTYDGSNSLSTRTLLELMSDSNFLANYHARFTNSFNYSYVAMNTKPDGKKHPRLFDQKRIRKAIAMLIPYDDINKVVNQGQNMRMVGPVSRFKKEFDTTLTPVPYDVKSALRLLNQEGWTDSNRNGILDKTIDGKLQEFQFTLSYHINSPEWKDYATLLQEAFTKAGLKVELQPMDIAVMMSNARAHDYDMFIGSMGQSSAPEDFTQLWHTNSWESGGSNFTGFGNLESDAIIDTIKTIVDLNKRIPLSHRFQRIVYEEQPMAFLFCSTRRNVIHKRFQNAEMYFERPGIQLNQLQTRTSSTP
jgi:peptide/nickel transport system substrate-binding protein